jgi:hypothetical protein
MLAVSTLLFGLAVIVERRGIAHKAPVTSEQTGEVHSSGEAEEGSEQAEGVHDETANNEVVLGINLENPWIVWGFVGVSLMMILAILRFGKTALLLTIALAALAAVLDSREAIFQFAANNISVASLAVIVALTHAAAAILAFVARRSYTPLQSWCGIPLLWGQPPSTHIYACRFVSI